MLINWLFTWNCELQEALSNLDDNVMTLIKHSTDPRLKKSQDILSQIEKRQFVSTVH